MGRYFGLFAVVGIAVAAIVVGGQKWTEKTVELDRQQSLAKLQSDYYERVGWIRAIPDEKAYRSEVGSFLGWYFKEVNAHMNRFGGNRNFDDYLHELDGRANRPGKNDRLDEKRLTYEYVKKTFDSLRARDYSPVWSASDRGVRLDVVAATIEAKGGEQKIHLPVVVWGLPRTESVSDRGLKNVKTSGSFQFIWRLFDEKGKLVGEIPGEGGPDNRVDWPERFVSFFPPQTMVGHYDFDRVPAEVKTAEITFTVTAQSTTGGEIRATFPWKLDVPAAWKLGAGEVWKGATETTRPEEEIDPEFAKKGRARR